MKSYKIQIKPEVLTYIERLNYICESYTSLLKILTREITNENKITIEPILDKYRKEYQQNYIQFKLAVDKIISIHFKNVPDSIKYHIDFNKGEMLIEWNDE